MDASTNCERPWNDIPSIEAVTENVIYIDIRSKCRYNPEILEFLAFCAAGLYWTLKFLKMLIWKIWKKCEH